MGGLFSGGGGGGGMGGGGEGAKAKISNVPTGKPYYVPPSIDPAGAAAELDALNKQTSAATARTLLTSGALGAGAAGLPRVLG